MPIWNPTFNGDPIFGVAVRMSHIPNANLQQISTFFGETGQFSMYGGGRGRIFLVVGVLVGEDIAELNQWEQVFTSYADGLAYTLIDTRGREWEHVQFKGELQMDEKGPQPLINGGWALPYKAVFHGLI